MLGNQIDWNGLPIICEMLGVDDVELLIHQLFAIREHLENMSRANRRS